MKKILFSCIVIFGAVWLFADFSRFNTWLKENAPSLALVGSVMALMSYNNSVRVARRNARRASVELAARECSKFGTETIPQLTALRETLEAAGCKYFENFRTIRRDERLDPDATLVTDADKSLLQSQRQAITKSINAVESFAIPFCEGVAATDVGFTECGPAFIDVFQEYFGLFSRADLEWAFPSTQRLYWRWRRRMDFVESMGAFWRAYWSFDVLKISDSAKAAFTAWKRTSVEYTIGEFRRIMMLPVTEQAWKRPGISNNSVRASAVALPPAKDKKSFSWVSIISICIAIAAVSISAIVAYLQNREHHDLVARVLRAKFWTLNQPSELFVEVALVNRGNQPEIIREFHLLVSDDENTRGGYTIYPQVLNKRIEKGEKQVFRSSITNFFHFESKPKWLSVEIVAIAPDADDVRCVWPVVHFTIATNGQGGGMSEHTNAFQPVQIISKKRLPHQIKDDRHFF